MKRGHLFDIELESLFALFLQHTLQEFPKECVTKEIEGSCYKKSLSGFANQRSQVSVVIQTYKPNQQITVQVTNNKEVFTSHYRFRAVEEKSALEYEECYSTDEFLRGINHMLMKLIFRKRIIQSIENKFASIEQLVQGS